MNIINEVSDALKHFNKTGFDSTEYFQVGDLVHTSFGNGKLMKIRSDNIYEVALDGWPLTDDNKSCGFFPKSSLTNLTKHTFSVGK
jgi:hypothetical protein